jgi:hypothetical protein|nr:MAG TPA: hypothetical protein [Caudoviricetes sp.]
MYDFASAYEIAQTLSIIASAAAIGLVITMVIQD